MLRHLFIIIAIWLGLAGFIGQIVIADEQVVVVHKSARKLNEPLFSSRVVDVKKGDVLEFQIIVENVSSDQDFPQVRLVDILPKDFIFLVGSVTPDQTEQSTTESSRLWIVRALKAKELRTITYKAQFLGDPASNPVCYLNVANLFVNGVRTNSTRADVCTQDKTGRVLSSINNQPKTAITDILTLPLAVGLTFLGYGTYLLAAFISRRG